MDTAQLAGLEALLFMAEEPVPTPVLAEAVGAPEHDVDDACARMARELSDGGRGISVRRSGGGWRMYTSELAYPVVDAHLLAGRSGRLSTAALETLAVIAYRQPITRSVIGEIRGVNPDGAVRSLVARGYVEEVGRVDAPGQPVLYGTTTRFLEELGIDDVDELPDLADHLEDDAPDEPVDPRAARRHMASGGTLPRTGGGRWDPADPGVDEGTDADDTPDDATPDDDTGAPLRDDTGAPLRDDTGAPLRDDTGAPLRDDGGLGPPSGPGSRDDEEMAEVSERLGDRVRSMQDTLRAVLAAQEPDDTDDGS